MSLKVWPDIWLNEGFATYTEWLWEEHEGTRGAGGVDDTTAASPGRRSRRSRSQPADLFGDAVYDRGAMTLHALRVRIGDRPFFRLLRESTTSNRYGNVRTADFVRLAERLSGQDLGAFFDAWLTGTAAPPKS